MRFFEIAVSGAALLAAAFAIELNEVPSSIVAGETYTITYSPKDDVPTTFVLRKGDPNNLDTVGTLTTSATGGSFAWTVDANLPNGDDYAIEIIQGDEFNYSGLIPLTGGTDEEEETSTSGYPTGTLSSTTPSSTPVSSETPVTTTGTANATTTEVSTITSASSVSGIISSTLGSNSTITSATLSRSTTGGASATTSSGPPEQTENAAALLGASPIALIMGAIAAMAYL